MILINYEGGRNLEWHIGEPIPNQYNFFDGVNKPINYIQADCDELEYIINLFSYSIKIKDNNGWSIPALHTIPIPRDKRIVTWYGDIAKTIVANL